MKFSRRQIRICIETEGKKKKKTSPSFTLYLDYSYSMRYTVSSFTCGIFLWEICYLHAHNRYSIQMSNNPAARCRTVCSRGASFLSGNDFTVNYTPFQRTVPFCRFFLREFACDAIVDANYNCDISNGGIFIRSFLVYNCEILRCKVLEM